MWHIRQVKCQVAAWQGRKPDCSPPGLGIAAFTRGRWCVHNLMANIKFFIHLFSIRFVLYADCSWRYTSMKDASCTSCGPGTGVKCDEGLPLWQQRGRKNSLQLWNSFQKWHLERQNADEKEVKIYKKDLPILPLFSFIFICVLYFTCIAFFIHTWISDVFRSDLRSPIQKYGSSVYYC